MSKTSWCRHFLILGILVVGSAPAALAAVTTGEQCSGPSFFSPLSTTAKVDGIESPSPVFRPQDADPARSQARPMDCTQNNFQHQSGTHGESSSISCDDAFAKIAHDGDLDAQNGCCNLGGSVWWESAPQGTCDYQYPPGTYNASGYINYKCQFCVPPSC